MTKKEAIELRDRICKQIHELQKIADLLHYYATKEIPQ